MTAVIERIHFGEIIQVKDNDGVAQKNMVAHNCGKDTNPAFYDETCNKKFANVGNLTIHLEEDPAITGPHRLVAYCRTHRWFEELSADQYAGFEKAGMTQ